MADEEKVKAEKLAAAKKKYEQIKKQKQKESKKTDTKKATDKVSTEKKVDDETDAAEKKVDDEKDATEKKADDQTDAVDGDDNADVADEDEAVPATRAESFKDGPHGEVQELYRKQTARIEELEKENKELQNRHEENTTRLNKAEEELETLREGNSDVAVLKSKAKEAESLGAELASVQRQLAQAQQSAKGNARRQTVTSSDLTQQLETKTTAIETLELEVSNLKNQVSALNNTISERDDAIKDAEDRITAAEAATHSAKQEIDALKVSIAFPSDDTKAASEDPEALTKRISVLESDLRTATLDINAASQKANTLQQKLDALTKLHRDGTSASQAKDRELSDLRTQMKRRDRPSHVRDASEFDLQDDETETGHLQARIRALEAETFDLRRGVWREKRGSDPTDQDGLLEYEDVDLSTPYSARRGSFTRPNHSTFQDVINSGISAFTGRSVEPGRTSSTTNATRPRNPSLGLLSEDGFDEDAFRMAQEEEAKRRIERVKDVKRALPQWKGWRVDLVELRQGDVDSGRDVGPIFEV